MRIRGFSSTSDFTPDHQVAFENAVAFAIADVTAADVQIINYRTSAGELMVDYQVVSSNATARATAWATTEQWGQNTTAREVWGDTIFRAAIEADGAAVPPGFRVTGATEPLWVAVWPTPVPTHVPTLVPDVPIVPIAAAPKAPADDASGLQALKFELIIAACCVMAIAGYVQRKLIRRMCSANKTNSKDSLAAGQQNTGVRAGAAVMHSNPMQASHQVRQGKGKL
jgi:hypothetical protein